ncbi:MAG: GNAT family N-acetyltransferase [Acidobacteriota bacterium]
MDSSPRLSTRRLLLWPSTLALAEAELEGRESLARGLGAAVPRHWPPPLHDRRSMAYNRLFLRDNPESVGWGLWYFLRPTGDRGLPELIGGGGFQGLPTSAGTVEIGYSILPHHQRQGFAPEAVEALVRWAFEQPRVKRVTAETRPDSRPSIRVLEKCGFRQCAAAEILLFERLP